MTVTDEGSCAAETPQTGDEVAAGLAGRAAVRVHLLARVAEAGVKPPKGKTVAETDEMLTRLVDLLSYMDPANLMTLAEHVLDHAALHGLRWPSEIEIRQWAFGMQPRPVTEKRIVTSWLASIEGPAAQAGGYLTELYLWLRLHGRPPAPYDMRIIRERSEDAERQKVILTDRAERGTIQPHDRQWLEARLRADAVARAIVARGEAGRAMRAEAAAA